MYISHILRDTAHILTVSTNTEKCLMRYSILLIVLLLFNCNNPNRNRPDSLREIEFDSIVPYTEVNDCTFDTSSHKFTTEAIRKGLPNQKFQWNNITKEAMVPFDNGDTLTLHIGGCHHFSFLATFRTDSSKFTDNDYLFDKTRWLTSNFFSFGIDSDYEQILDNKEYEIDKNSEANFRIYNIIDTTLIENHVHEGFYFKSENKRTEIWVHGYIN